MTTASRTIFYSWQAETPNNTNRGFLHDALERAAEAIALDLAIAPVIERDTQNVPGSPDIARTIFGKIETCDLFVADITLVNRDDATRRTPNPNVLLESSLNWIYNRANDMRSCGDRPRHRSCVMSARSRAS